MKITLIGMGCGSSGLTEEAAAALSHAQIVIGPERLLQTVTVGCPKKEAVLPRDILSILEMEVSLCSEACILYSGDSGFYSGARLLLPLLKGHEVMVLPGITSLQLFAARLCRPWQGWRLCSAHGRPCDVIFEVCHGVPVFFLTGGQTDPSSICRELVTAGLGFLTVTVGEDLGSAKECISAGTAEEFAARVFSPLSVLLVENAPRVAGRCPGFPDDAFERADKIPMTKQEVRSVALAKLAIAPEEVCWDIGSGTGSIGIEMAFCCRSVWAVEKDPAAITVAMKNRSLFGAWNLHLVEGLAPAVFSSLPVPDAVFIGGSKGNLSEILQKIAGRNPKVRVCISAVSIETLSLACRELVSLGFQIEISQIQISRSRTVGDLHLMMAQNPVYLITGVPA